VTSAVSASAWRLSTSGLLAGLLFVAACASPGPLTEPQALRERAEKDEAALLKRVRVSEDPRLAAYLARVAERLLAPPTLRVIVVEDPTLGAFAISGSCLFVHTGLLSRLENEAQLAAILGREMSRDPSRLTPRSTEEPMRPVALGPTAAAILGLDLRLAARAAIDGHGPSLERAADADAARRLAAAGYDPREAAGTFERLVADSHERSGLQEIFFYGNPQHMSTRALPEATPTGVTARPEAGEFARVMRSVARDNAALDLRAGRFELARRQLDRALAADPDDPIAHLLYGDLLRLASQRAADGARSEGVRQAAERYRRAAELDPGYAEPFRQLGLLYYQEGDVAGTRAAFERYLAVKPTAADAPRVREYLAILATGRRAP
jgi:beta-barrel assembly-enhancing protease